MIPSQMLKGTLEGCILGILSQKETYGYEIIAALNAHGAAVLGYAKEGTVYPILYRLQQSGLIGCRIAPAAANGGSRKYYSLTEKGRAALQELIAFWKQYSACVNEFIGDCAPEVEA